MLERLCFFVSLDTSVFLVTLVLSFHFECISGMSSLLFYFVLSYSEFFGRFQNTTFFLIRKFLFPYFFQGASTTL